MIREVSFKKYTDFRSLNNIFGYNNMKKYKLKKYEFFKKKIITPRLLNLEGTHAGKKSTRLQRPNPTTNPWTGYKYLRSYSTAGKIPFFTPKKNNRLIIGLVFFSSSSSSFLILLLFIFLY